ncbi:hypothetical protein ACFYRW_03950 [Rhodococcus pyridinivorans]|uniref:hypothetical protein n=1 Tax=Rhodococcus TaxID=1827 RepID=UPI000903A68D|nr:hypothetical protein [Rhodococcus sp. 2G]APE09299.1 hypothetical protein BO226_08810 [Rhodococcus sp. 2G]
MDTVEQLRRMPRADAGLLGIAALAGAALVAASGHYWPTGRSDLLVVAAAILVLLGVGLGWALRMAFDRAHGRRWRWHTSALPSVVLVAVGIAMLVRPDFEHARPQFEQIAADLRASPERSYAHDLRLGRFDVDVAYDTTAGEVYFHDARSWPVPHSSPGWVYFPDRTPRDIERLNLASIGKGWYRFDNVTVD